MVKSKFLVADYFYFIFPHWIVFQRVIAKWFETPNTTLFLRFIKLEINKNSIYLPMGKQKCLFQIYSETWLIDFAQIKTLFWETWKISLGILNGKSSYLCYVHVIPKNCKNKSKKFFNEFFCLQHSNKIPFVQGKINAAAIKGLYLTVLCRILI